MCQKWSYFDQVDVTIPEIPKYDKHSGLNNKNGLDILTWNLYWSLSI